MDVQYGSLSWALVAHAPSSLTIVCDEYISFFLCKCFLCPNLLPRCPSLWDELRYRRFNLGPPAGNPPSSLLSSSAEQGHTRRNFEIATISASHVTSARNMYNLGSRTIASVGPIAAPSPNVTVSFERAILSYHHLIILSILSDLIILWTIGARSTTA
jgi:hypothetical protein